MSFLMLAVASSDGGDSSPTDDGPVDLPHELGSYAVGHTAFTETDTDRNDRSLLFDVWYPVDRADARREPVTEYPLTRAITPESKVAVDGLPVSSADGPFTLLVFSHGFGGINTQSTQLMESLAHDGPLQAVSPRANRLR